MSKYARACLALAAVAFIVAAPARAALFSEDPKRSIDYSPSSALIAHGAVQIGTFTYLPAVNGKLKPYAVRNNSYHDVVFEKSIDKVIQESLLEELRFVGVKIDSGPVLTGEIKEFFDDDIGGSIVTLTVRYIVTDANGAVLYDAEKTVKQGLCAGNVNAFACVLTANFEALIGDPAFHKAIDPSGAREVTPAPARLPGVSLTYVPASGFIAGGAVAIGSFDYQSPAGGKIEADQIRNTALGNIHLDRTVGTYVAEALLKELRLTGVTVESKDRVLNGTIVELSCDDLGYTSDWTVRVKYVVKDAAGNIVYEAEKATKEVTAKYLETLITVLRHNFEALLLDEAFLKAIGAPAGISNTAESVTPSTAWKWVESSGYGPRSALVAHGAVTVGPFAYPLANGKVKPNQIPNRALTDIMVDRPISEIMHDMTLNELRFTGINVHAADRVLTGEIQKYKIDDLSERSEWIIAVRFVVKDKAGAILYDAVKSATPTKARFVYDFREMTIVIEALISDPEFIKAIN